GRLTASAQPLRPGHDPPLLPGARLPGRLTDPGRDLRSQWRPADLVLRPHAAEGRRDGRDRLLEEAALTPDPSGRAWGGRPDRTAAVPRPARRALPGLRAARQPRRVPLSRKLRRR